MTLARKKLLHFYKNKKKVGTVVLDHVKKEKLIVFGSRSLNKQLPPHLRRQTEDYDLLIPAKSGMKAKNQAEKIEKKLDEKFKADIFITEPAAHEGTYKIKTKKRLGGVGFVDITMAEDKVSTIKKGGIRYSSIKHEKKNIRKSLNDPKSKFRHGKDRERLLRINLAKSQRKARKKPVMRKKPLLRRNISVNLGDSMFRMPNF